MYILHIETATGNCSIALSKGDTLLECLDMTEGMNHTALLAPAIDLVLKKFSLKPGDLSAISVSAGPGSYTGLRVGSSTAKAMAYSLDIPLLAIPTLYSLAKAFFSIHPEARFVIPMLDARRLEVYTALYDVELNELQPPYSAILDSPGFMGNLPSAKTIYAVGDGAGKIERIPSLASRIVVDPGIQCSARHLVSPALEMLEKGKKADPLHFVPIYLKPPNITETRKEGVGGK